MFAIEPAVNNVGDLSEIVKRVAAFRKTHAQEKREEEREKKDQKKYGGPAVPRR